MEAGHVDKAWYDEFFGMLSDDVRETRQYGRFASFEGVIYKDFNMQTHCIGNEIWDMIQDCNQYRGIDWGAGKENAFSCHWGARNKFGAWLIYDEYYSTNQSYSTVEHLCDIQLAYEWPRNSLFHKQTFGDPADPDNLRIAQQLKKYTKGRDDDDQIQPMPITPAKNSVLRGINHLKCLMKASWEWNGKRYPKLLIHKQNCPNLIRQLRTYRWERGYEAGGRMVKNPRDARPVPLKFNDHACDSLRYLVFSPDSLDGLTIDSVAARHSSGVEAAMPGGEMDIFAHRGKTN
jgi:hypothetical protein